MADCVSLFSPCLFGQNQVGGIYYSPSPQIPPDLSLWGKKPPPSFSGKQQCKRAERLPFLGHLSPLYQDTSSPFIRTPLPPLLGHLFPLFQDTSSPFIRTTLCFKFTETGKWIHLVYHNVGFQSFFHLLAVSLQLTLYLKETMREK